MSIRLYNTLTRRKEELDPVVPGRVGMYACGPTVYNYAHIGNLRTYVFEDILRRVIIFNGLKLTHVMNLTDVDDKTIRDSLREGLPLKEFTDRYIGLFFSDLTALNIQRPDIVCRATEHIPEMLAMIEQLSQRGYAYRSGDGSTYFSLAKHPAYGRLSGIDLNRLKAGARVAHDEYDKENASDFALWKAWDQRDGGVGWDSPFGRGRPGWHIECSAMSTKYLGETFDIHAGAVDLIFPHHENEIAQTEAATGKPWVRCWVHAEHLLVDGGKMSKSLNNFHRLDDLAARGYDPLAYRYFCFTGHYRSQLNFTWESLTAAQRALENLRAEILKLRTDPALNPSPQGEAGGEFAFKQKFLEAVNDDLNMPQALAITWDLMRSSELSSVQKLGLVNDFDRVLGLKLAEPLLEEAVPPEVQRLLEQRHQARAARNWVESDRLRAQISSLGFVVEDGPKGQTVRPKKFGE